MSSSLNYFTQGQKKSTRNKEDPVILLTNSDRRVPASPSSKMSSNPLRIYKTQLPPQKKVSVKRKESNDQSHKSYMSNNDRLVTDSSSGYKPKIVGNINSILKTPQMKQGHHQKQNQSFDFSSLRKKQQKSGLNQSHLYSNKIDILDTNLTENKNFSSSYIHQSNQTGNDIDITPFKTQPSVYLTQDNTTSQFTFQKQDDKAYSTVQDIQIKRRLRVAEEDLDKISRECYELQQKVLRREKIILNLQVQYDQSAKSSQIKQLTEIRLENAKLGERFRELLKSKEDIKLRMRSVRSDTINSNLLKEEQLASINEQIRELERTYFKMNEDIKYTESQNWRVIEKNKSLQTQIELVLQEKDSQNQIMRQYHRKIERLEMDMINQKYEHQAFIKVNHKKTQYEMKCSAMRQLTSILKIKNLRYMSEAFSELTKKDRKFEVISRMIANFSRFDKVTRKDKLRLYFDLWNNLNFNTAFKGHYQQVKMSNVYKKRNQDLKFALSKWTNKNTWIKQKLQGYRKNQRLQDQYQSKHQVQMIEVESQIGKLQNEQQEKALSILKRSLLRWKGQKIRPYFLFWHSLVKEEKRVNHWVLYRKLKNYKLNQAFGQWKFKAQQARNNQKIELVEEIQESAKEEVQNIVKLKEEISELKDQSISKGKMKLSRVIKHQIMIPVQQSFDRWRLKTENNRRQTTRLRVVFAQMLTRRLRMAFQLYAKQAKKTTRYINHDKLIKQYHGIYNFRLLKYFYNVLQYNKQLFQEQKSRIQILCHKKHRKTQRLVMNQIQAVLNMKQVNKVNMEEMQEIQSYNESSHEVAVKQAQLQEQKVQITQCEKQVGRLGALNLTKFCNRIKNYQYHKAFKQWFDITKDGKSQLRQLLHLSQIIARKDKSTCFTYWKNVMLDYKIQLAKNRGQYLQKTINQIYMQMLQEQKESKLKKDYLVERLDAQQIVIKKFTHTHNGLINIMFRQKNQMKETKLHHYVLRQWRERNIQMKRRFSRICNMLQNYQLKIGFQQITQRYSDLATNSNTNPVIRESKINQALKVLRRGFIRSSFSQWKSKVMLYRINTNQQLSINLNILGEQRTDSRRQYTNAIAKLMKQDKSENNLVDIFVQWKNLISQQKILRIKQKELNESQQYLNIQNALKLWNQRTKKTQKYRSKCYSVGIRNDRSILRAYFNGLKYHVKELKSKQRSIACIINDILIKKKQMAFQYVKSFTQEKPTVIQQNYQRFAQLLSKQIKSKMNSTTKSCLSDIKLHARQQKLRNTQLKMILRVKSLQLSKAFLRWKQQASLEDLENEQLNEGPIRLETFDLRVQFMALKDLLKNQEKIEDRDICDVIQQKQTEDDQLMLKAITRMKLYNENNFYLPKYFDRLKSHWQKKMHLKLKLKPFLQKYLFDTGSAFQIFKDKYEVDKNSLENTKAIELRKKFIQHSNQQEQIINLTDISDVLSYQNERTNDYLLDQKDKAQMIVLRYFKKRDNVIALQYLIKWWSISKDQQKQEVKKRLDQRQKILHQLQDQLSVIQQQNQQLSSRNKELGEQAIEGIHLGSQFEQLSQQKTDLSIELADKIFWIKKLLEENKSLNIRYSQQKLYGSLQKSESLNSLKRSNEKQRDQYASIE
ncbi:UNKNOWN [Stylonychia lemnae]|uniref:Uncharacterized protein n=1 Tax=Stylonychia lemnae TaxID=5949 RepID=A0A077ZZX3_STYLE|nr:UNKNOWN [Stylonychia lemnae]|eukprot:CDW74068.1 UNKNOWN [Stylonychia lemnae]